MMDQTDLMVLVMALASMATVLLLGLVMVALGMVTRLLREMGKTAQRNGTRARLEELNRHHREMEAARRITSGQNPNETSY